VPDTRLDTSYLVLCTPSSVLRTVPSTPRPTGFSKELPSLPKLAAAPLRLPKERPGLPNPVASPFQPPRGFCNREVSQPSLGLRRNSASKRWRRKPFCANRLRRMFGRRCLTPRKWRTAQNLPIKNRQDNNGMMVLDCGLDGLWEHLYSIRPARFQRCLLGHFGGVCFQRKMFLPGCHKIVLARFLAIPTISFGGY
jgi:hypothetical protein